MGRSEHFAEGTKPHYRNATPASPETYGVQHMDAREMPKQVLAHHHLLGPNNDKHGDYWTGTKAETVEPSTPIKTAQDFVGVEHVQGYAKRLRPGATSPVDFKQKGTTDDDQDDGRPRLLRHEGELYHIDGLHRVAAARSVGRSFRARIFDTTHSGRLAAYPAPHDLIGHLSEDHVRDNDMVDSDTDWPHAEVKGYHEELHAGGVADHHHT